ncbi:MAG: hypothetical protein R3D02_02950 [Hyphomicrobiales bacterium]
MNRRIFDEMLADLLMEQVGAEVIDESAAGEISGALAAFIGEPVTKPEARIVIGLERDTADWMWGGATRH